MKKVEINKSQLLLNDFFKIEEAFLKFEKYNGEMSNEVRRLNLDRGDSVTAILWHKDRQKMIFTEQFRYPTHQNGDGWMLELLAGGVAKGENPEEALIREIEEEVGYKVNIVKYLCNFYASPGGTSERVFLYYAEVDDSMLVGEGGGLDHEDEDIKVIEYSLEECWELFMSGKVNDAKTIIGLLMFKRELAN
ncbi:NUDIX hydrolase [Flammeovirgaceae bacterium SG7u.111]|nr:NUDIX hydrolase [Flammeovirgaceae bacterium SG7u.132]WPO34398.1 NUDIX hydrolase [Flammeovirgaceae bacterium SG7u.111]